MTITRHETGSALAIRDDQSGWTPQQVAALHQLGVGNASEGDLAVFFHQAQRTGLDPFKREIYMIGRQGKQTIQTGIDGFYKIADRVSRATGGTWGITETYWCGEDGQWRDVWLPTEAPAAAKVIVERNGSRFTTVALTREYKAAGPMWQKMPSRMIAKCAEALAIRKAFPEDLSGLYTADEMQQADRGQAASQAAPEGRLGADGIRARIAAKADPADEPEEDTPLRRLGRAMKAADLLGDPAEALAWIGNILEREVTSTKDLTPHECTRLATLLETGEDIEPVDAELVTDERDPWAEEADQ